MLPTRRLFALCCLVPAALLLAQIPAQGADDGAGPGAVARDANGLTPAELDHLLSSDSSAHIDNDGRVYFIEPVAPAVSGSGRAQGVAPFPLGNTFQLHSKPGSNLTLFIDVDGTTVAGTSWNNAPYNVPAGSYPAWDPAGNGASFADSEKEEVQKIWQRVAEDYAPFNIDVTTQDPGLAGIERDSFDDLVYGTRALVTPSLTAETAICGTPPACGGVAYIGTIGQLGSARQPAWVFPHELGPNDTKNIAEAITHEVGHNFGLQHDGRTSPAEGYYAGHDMWAPIMGAGYSRPVTQWSKGEYASASNTGQNDVALIAARAPYIADEAGGTIADAASGLPTVGYITRATDADTFLLGPCAGTVTVSATGAAPSPNLDLELELLDSVGTVVATNNPASAYVSRDAATGLSASISTGVAAGTFYARVDGVGNGTAATGYTDYGSIGAYTLSVTGCALPATAPGAPTNLQVTPNASGTAATVTWAAPASDGGSPVIGYTVSRTGAAPEDQVTFSKTWTGLTPGTNYVFAVAARNAIGAGAPASQSVTMPVAPTAPASLQVSPAANGQSATVTWAPPASDGGGAVTGYTISRTGAAPEDQSTLSKLWTGLTPGATYLFSVTARNGVGSGPPASQSVTMPVAPTAPTNLRVTPAANGRAATVTWSPPTSEGGSAVTGYALTRTGGASVDLGAVGSHTWTGLAPGATYTFTVTAKNALGTGPQASASASTPTTPGAPAIGKAQSGQVGGKKTAKVSWSALANTGGSALTGYQVLVFNKSGTLVKSVNLAAGKTSYQAKLKGGKYRFAVVAVNAVGAGAQSALSKRVTAQ